MNSYIIIVMYMSTWWIIIDDSIKTQLQMNIFLGELIYKADICKNIEMTSGVTIRSTTRISPDST